jgi:hypothetical protein
LLDHQGLLPSFALWIDDAFQPPPVLDSAVEQLVLSW